MPGASEAFLSAAAAADAHDRPGQGSRILDLSRPARSRGSIRAACLAVAGRAEAEAQRLDIGFQQHARGYGAYFRLLWDDWRADDVRDCEMPVSPVPANESEDASWFWRDAFAHLLSADYERAQRAARKAPNWRGAGATPSACSSHSSTACGRPCSVGTGVRLNRSATTACEMPDATNTVSGRACSRPFVPGSCARRATPSRPSPWRATDWRRRGQRASTLVSCSPGSNSGGVARMRPLRRRARPARPPRSSSDPRAPAHGLALADGARSRAGEPCVRRRPPRRRGRRATRREWRRQRRADLARPWGDDAGGNPVRRGGRGRLARRPGNGMRTGRRRPCAARAPRLDAQRPISQRRRAIPRAPGVSTANSSGSPTGSFKALRTDSRLARSLSQPFVPHFLNPAFNSPVRFPAVPA